MTTDATGAPGAADVTIATGATGCTDAAGDTGTTGQPARGPEDTVRFPDEPVRFPEDVERRLASVRQIADAVLFEGYVLYPYRASAAKNQLRWQFGVLVPPGWAAVSGEPAHQRTELLMEPRPGARLAVELRFLRARRRTVQRATEGGRWTDVSELDLGERVLVPWDEGVEEHVRLLVPVEDLARDDGVTHAFRLPACEEEEQVDEAGVRVGRLLRARESAEAVIRLRTQEVPGPYGALRLTAVVENTSGWTATGADRRDAALPHSLVSAHLLLALDRGTFLSVTDPPRWAAPAVAGCRNEHTWPVLAGEPGRDQVVLSSPIILEDHPRIAPESPGALYDATEIDEILALRTAALTDREKREARGTDDRAGAVIDLADSMPPEVLERLHGAIRALDAVSPPPDPADALDRFSASPLTGVPDDGVPTYGVPADPAQPWWDPGADRDVDPARDRVLIDGRQIGAGSRVVLGAGGRRTDAQDAFLHGRTALVEAVLHDVDGSVHLAVTVEGDPGADIWRAQGRFRYFQPDEVTPLEES
ncbi:hypothetical protein [Streptomyces uncialis]|uniref:hypothetical protein n=1 Tax=Streptomyces uncialis TaxID=1048205 RepID=UPI000AA5C9FB|nr:hypothetical protein [Streptomyces uncialis]